VVCSRIFEIRLHLTDYRYEYLLTLFIILAFQQLTTAQEILALYLAGTCPIIKMAARKKKEKQPIFCSIADANADIAMYLPPKRNATGHAVVICPGG
jgi:hypothetical protein